MAEEQVEVVILVVDGDPFLTRHKGKITAQLEDERLQLAEDCLLHVHLAGGSY